MRSVERASERIMREERGNHVREGEKKSAREREGEAESMLVGVSSSSEREEGPREIFTCGAACGASRSISCAIHHHRHTKIKQNQNFANGDSRQCLQYIQRMDEHF